MIIILPIELCLCWTGQGYIDFSWSCQIHVFHPADLFFFPLVWAGMRISHRCTLVCLTAWPSTMKIRLHTHVYMMGSSRARDTFRFAVVVDQCWSIVPLPIWFIPPRRRRLQTIISYSYCHMCIYIWAGLAIVFFAHFGPIQSNQSSAQPTEKIKQSSLLLNLIMCVCIVLVIYVYIHHHHCQSSSVHVSVHISQSNKKLLLKQCSHLLDFVLFYFVVVIENLFVWNLALFCERYLPFVFFLVVVAICARNWILHMLTEGISFSVKHLVHCQWRSHESNILYRCICI